MQKGKIRAGRNNKGIMKAKRHPKEKNGTRRSRTAKPAEAFSDVKCRLFARIFVRRDGEREEEDEETNNIIPDRDIKNRQRGINLSHLHLCFSRSD
jgi:hypothetical protein